MKRAPLVLLLGLVACAPNRGEGFERSVNDARAAYGAGRFDEAAQRWDDAAKRAKVPRDAVYARYEAALARARAGDVAGGAAALRKIADENVEYSAEAAYKAADLSFKVDPAAGYRELEAMALRFPDSPYARVALERLIRHDDEAGAATAMARLDAFAPKVQGKSLEMDVAYERAKRLEAMGRHEQARDSFIAVANQWPYPKGNYFDDALFRAAEIEEKLQRPNEAIALLERMLQYRETSVTIGSYERPRYIPAMLKIAAIYEDQLHDRGKARDAYHRLYTEFKTSTLRDDALWREADLWTKDGDTDKACARLDTLVSNLPDSRYVPCAIDRCKSIERPKDSKAPRTCHAYLLREPVRPDDPK
ncbi:MAG: tetratricopeptide repeat protein [Labilithrix sp.]